MNLVLFALGGSYLLELLIFAPLLFKFKRFLSVVVMFATLAASILMALELSLLAASAFGLVTAYRLFNLYRVGFGLSHVKRLLHGGFKTSWHLAVVNAILLALAVLVRPHFELASILLVWSFLAFAIACVSLIALRLSLKRMAMPVLASHTAHRDLPTLTIAIPARNETEDLTECLASLVKSDYPKLEIITLDDCSQTRRTPEIIRQFAHDGVRFMKGEVPPEPWLAKNYAYKQLLDQANGEYILFCGVDARFEPHTVTRLVEAIAGSGKDMISLMPINHVSRGRLLPYLLQPVRYAWEIALARNWHRRPPVLSTCWIGKKDFLRAHGGFEAVMQSILPERHFARQAVRAGSYGFYRSDLQDVALTSVKSGPEQLDTAMRTRYPTLKRAPENVMFVSSLMFAMAVWPAAAGVYAYLNSLWTLLALNLATIILLSVLYAIVDKTTYNQFKLVSFIAMPFALMFDGLILIASMYKYEFSKVLWKGRNICLPLLQAIPELPKLSSRQH